MKFQQFINENNQTLIKNLQSKIQNQYDAKVSISLSGNKIEIAKIIVNSDNRNNGVGTNIILDIVNFADSNKLTIVLTPSSDFGGNKTKLISFYKKFNFVENKGKNKDYEISDTMYRHHK